MPPEIDLLAINEALQQIQSQIPWKPGKAYTHLKKRINRGHPSSQTSLDDYEAIIRTTLKHSEAFIYIYRFGPEDYPTVVAPYQGEIWLVMFGMNGIMETAFPPDNPKTYFESDPRYIPIGILRIYSDE